MDLGTRRRAKIIVTVVLLAGVSLAASLALLKAPAQAQQPATPTAPAAFPITFSGPVESVGPRFIVVNGLLVDLTGADVPATGLQLGAVVTVTGNLINNVIQATRVQLGASTGTGGQAPTPTPLALATRTPSIVDLRGSTGSRDDGRARRVIIQGPVSEVRPTSLRIFNLDVQFDPAVVNVTNIRVGDYVRVEGDFTVINNVFTIVAMNIVGVNPPAFRAGSDISGRDSVSDRSGGRAAPPPPPPPAPRGSGRSSISAPSGRSS